jgi:nitrogen fixation protein NifU and related proteins
MEDFSKLYSPLVLKHVAKPQNMGRIKNPDGTAMVGNPVCGDIMKYYIRVSQTKLGPIIKDIKFQTLGCGAAIATSSILTTLVKGKTIKEALKITKDKIVKVLGGLPPAKIHCSVLADECFKKAVKNYESKVKK